MNTSNHHLKSWWEGSWEAKFCYWRPSFVIGAIVFFFFFLLEQLLHVKLCCRASIRLFFSTYPSWNPRLERLRSSRFHMVLNHVENMKLMNCFDDFNYISRVCNKAIQARKFTSWKIMESFIKPYSNSTGLFSHLLAYWMSVFYGYYMHPLIQWFM